MKDNINSKRRRERKLWKLIVTDPSGASLHEHASGKRAWRSVLGGQFPFATVAEEKQAFERAATHVRRVKECK